MITTHSKGSFRFHNVGQGLFYSGILSKKDHGKNGRNTFCFVYDCGTNSSKDFLEREISNFKLLLPNKQGRRKLDLLVVSHFHDDHISGLESLLDGVDVNTVVIPYICEQLRQLSQIESEYSEGFLRDLYADPIGWFVSKSVQNVLLLGAEGNEEIEMSRAEMSFDEVPVINIDRNSILNSETYDGTNVVYLRRKTQLIINNLDWVFEFENLKIGPDMVDDYYRSIKSFLHSNNTTLEGVLKSKSLTRELKYIIKCINLGANAINRTSVVLLHGPVNPGLLLVQPSYLDRLFPKFIQAHWNTLLTGDISIRNGESIHIIDMYKGQGKERIAVLQYPHHGSKENDSDYFSSLSAIINVLSFGLTNNYGHPDASVINKLCGVICVNERWAFDYQIFPLF